MTEDEAKTKWCPMVRLGVTVGGEPAPGLNRFTNPNNMKSMDFAKCIGSACMMWRNAESEQYVNGMRLQHTSTYPVEAVVTVRHGYCGIAGKP